MLFRSYSIIIIIILCFTVIKRFIDGCLFMICLLLSSVLPEARPLCPPVQVDPFRYPEVGPLYHHQAEAH